ncbi:hypothetical protein FE257_010452 [Aspergillus nanangensis]|uniref:Xylanolytic transcriptional activator regulatory domain-containing protein n=1 Tax=Aspergillus nanangensis TaxID=2582783 RepID=A0AAD4CJ69_ASPNN|nr:hypothetical protein FE257_010452 [Aspergillus nanangensis]
MTPAGTSPSQHSNADFDHYMAEAVTNCKQLARDIKNQLPSRRPLPPGIHQTLPAPDLVDDLVRLYFATFESCYRILHYPTFQRQYEAFTDNPELADSEFIVKLLLILSAAGALHSDVHIHRALAAKARTWIHVAQTWLSAPLEKNRLSLDGVQIHCLLLLARQATRVGADLVWISAGSLVRMAMQMGLHQDPSRLVDMDLLNREMRRRLWYTILEMNVQAALDSGMSPMVSPEDYNTQLPSNLNDDDLVGATDEEGLCKPDSNTTQLSLHRLIAQSLPLRLKATGIINSLQDEPPYEEIVHVGNELSLACRDAASFINRQMSAPSSHWLSPFARSWCEHSLSRFLLCLHYPYAFKSHVDPLYSYSHTVCLDVAVGLVALLDDEPYHRLLLSGGGMYRDLITRAAYVIFLDLNARVAGDKFSPAKRRDRARREPLLEDARKIVRYTEDRMWHGETSIKAYVYLSAALARLAALLDGQPSKEVTIQAASRSVQVCRNILQSTTRDSAGQNPEGSALRSWVYGDIVALPTVADADLEVLNMINLDFDFSDPGQTWMEGYQG